ncbi:MAG: right-handed parallel beta-helix repeat-containing protein, partial [Planctomycetota bacterium]
MNLTARLLLSSLFALAACGGGGGGSTGNGPVTPPGPTTPPPPADTAPSPQASGLVAAAAGSGVVVVDAALPGAGFEAALFSATSASAVYVGNPVQGPLGGTRATVAGLADGTDAFFGLAIRPTGGTTWTPVGTVLRTRPGAPVYVDAAASATGANGQSPATAFPSLADAMLAAGAANGGNVWVRGGSYANGPFPLGPNVHVAGGFGAAFDLATRDPAANATVLGGSATQEIVSVLTGGSDGTLDGLVVDGNGTVLKGIDVVDGDVELRSVTVRRCADRGVKAVTTVPVPNRRLAIVGCTLTGNTSDGVSSAGSIDLWFDLSNFDANGQEGADVDDLQCPDNGSVSLRATGCRFYGNGAEGLDADLAAAPLAAGSGTFDVRIENCRFEVNGLDGLLLDQEHESTPGFAATIVVRGCVARANRGAGVHLDADARGTYGLDRLRCTANAGDGLLVTSETNAGEVVLGSSWLAGNLGAGARVASGNKVLVAAHCAFLGNQAGGLRAEVVAGAVCNSVFVRQTDPRVNAGGAGNVDASGDTEVFAVAPVAFTTVTAASNGTLTVAANAGFAAGTSVSAADDERRLAVAQSSATTLVLDQAPLNFATPGSLAAYAGTTVVDNPALAAASPARGVGLAAPGAAATDAGP